MRWHHKIHWKLFISHLVILGVAAVALLSTAYIMAGVGFVHITSSTENVLLERFEVVVRNSLFAAVFAAIVASAVMSLFISRRIVEPLQDIAKVSRHLAQGFYRERTMVMTDDELAELGQSVNQLAEALEKTEHRRMALLADVIHELRTPLTTIEGYMEGLLDGVVQQNEHTYTLVLHESVRMKRLIEDLELLSRAEAGQIQVNLRPIDLRIILADLVTQFQLQFAAKQIDLLVALPVIFPAVWADPDRVQQIGINLLNNALRYTPEGGKVIVQAWGEQEYAVVCIKDTGVGIAPEHLQHLFERFYRVDKSRARTSGGSGIGLTISRHLVHAHGGDIWAKSDGRGFGTRFYFTLMWASEPAPDIYKPDERERQKIGEMAAAA